MKQIASLFLLICIVFISTLNVFASETPFLIADSNDAFGKVTSNVDKNKINIVVDYRGSHATDFKAHLFKGKKKVASFKKIAVGGNSQKIKLSWTDPGGNPLSGTYVLQMQLYKNGDIYKKKSVNIKVKGKLSFKKCEKDSEGKHIFKIEYRNLIGKQIIAELYDKNDKLVKSFKFVPKNYSGTLKCTWNGYPKKGAKCRSGNYSLKYWADGVSPKTKRLVLEMGEEDEY